MISTNQYSLSWKHFEDVNSNKQEAFENMCRSLFKRNKVLESEILHSDPNHPGVEVSPVRSKDGDEMISFQAKYFDNNVDYRNIQSSISTAITYYKDHLDTIYLYCNKDINRSCRSFQNIDALSTASGIKIILVNGQSILDEAMDFPSVLACYFGLDSLDDGWFEKNLQISLSDLGKRYNSVFNIDTNAEHQLGLFLKNDVGINLINKKKVEALNLLSDLMWKADSKYRESIRHFIKTIKEIKDITTNDISHSLDWKAKFESLNAGILSDLAEKKESITAKLEDHKKSEEVDKLRSELFIIRKLQSVSDILGLSEHERLLLTEKVLVVTGEMGVGKSQLLASSAQKTLEQGNPTLLLLGQTFISEDPIEVQIINGLVELDNNVSFDSLLAVMDEKAFLNNSYAPVYIDAINETCYKQVWQTSINRLLATVKHYSNILLVVSLRNKFEQLVFSEKVIEDMHDGRIASINHIGLEDDNPRGIFDFLSYYGIPVSPDYYLQREMNNPLYLTWFCQTYSKDEYGIDILISKVLEKADNEASKASGSIEPLKLLKRLLMEFIEISDSGFLSLDAVLKLSVWDVYGVSNKVAYLNSLERSGVLVSYARNREERYYIGFNRLEEYVHATWIMENQKSKESVADYCLSNLLAVDESGRVKNTWNISTFAMVTSLYSNEYGEECLELIDRIGDEDDKQYVVDECIKTFSWRYPHISLDGFVEMINHFNIAPDTVWDIFFNNSTKENSVLNSRGLSKLLMSYSLSKRDYLWTTYVNELSEFDRIVNLAYYFEAGNSLKDLSDDKVLLLLILYSWMLSASNRELRDRVSKAMIELLKVHFGLCKTLLENFRDVNDPYIIQRLYGITFGALMKCRVAMDKEFEDLALFVYSEVFLKEKVYPDILLRDYARLIVERFIYVYPKKKESFDISRLRPPYKSDPIPVVNEVDYSDEKYHNGGLYRLLFSIKFNADVKGIGMYGDFGRYIFQAVIGHFKGVDEKNIYYYAVNYILNELGYTNDLFGKYDTQMADFDRNHLRRVERIGKKYEWITLYNILARLSDSYMVEDWSGNVHGFYHGAWELFVRDFDPTMNSRYPVDLSLFPKFEGIVVDENRFIDMDSDMETVAGWVKTDDEMYSSLSRRLIRTDSNGVQWVSLYLHQEMRRKSFDDDEFRFGYARGEQHIWAISSVHILIDGSLPTVETLHSSAYVRQSMGMNSLRSFSGLFSREYVWSPGFAYESEEEGNDDNKCSIKAIPAVINVLWESQYDASQETTTSYLIPSECIIRALGLEERDIRGVFFFNDEIAAFDSEIVGDEYGELIIRKDLFDKFVKDNNAHLFWSMVGEKQFFIEEHNQVWQRREGYYLYNKGQIQGESRIVPNI
ncbi:MAG: hypothetical protein K6G47_05685 [Clostridia bacterium]|nr:hypothetical protein [Clostridia bacterium]